MYHYCEKQIDLPNNSKWLTLHKSFAWQEVTMSSSEPWSHLSRSIEATRQTMGTRTEIQADSVEPKEFNIKYEL